MNNTILKNNIHSKRLLHESSKTIALNEMSKSLKMNFKRLSENYENDNLSPFLLDLFDSKYQKAKEELMSIEH